MSIAVCTKICTKHILRLLLKMVENMFFLDSEYVGKGGWPPFLPPQKAIKWGKQFQVGKWGGDPPKSPLKNRPEMAK